MGYLDNEIKALTLSFTSCCMHDPERSVYKGVYYVELGVPLIG